MQKIIMGVISVFSFVTCCFGVDKNIEFDVEKFKTNDFYSIDVGLINGAEMRIDSLSFSTAYSSLVHPVFFGSFDWKSEKDQMVQCAEGWMKKYPNQLPEVCLFYLLGDGEVQNLLPFYEQSKYYHFRHYCQLAFCLEEMPLSCNPYITEKRNDSVQLSVEEGTNSISLVLSIKNDTQFMRRYCGENPLADSLQIIRSDGVPVFYIGELRDTGVLTKTFITPVSLLEEGRPIEKTLRDDKLVLPPHSTVTMKQPITALESIDYINRESIESLYIKEKTPVYKAFGAVVSGEITDALTLELRYVRDNNIFAGEMDQDPKFRNVPQIKIVSNAVYLTFDESGKLVSYSVEDDDSEIE
ncbi:MAG: hypothetical protein JXR40_13460 [Pontiellaceae bacterium]|nr:hypothetical protein [Pontiellaceae bacterium]